MVKNNKERIEKLETWNLLLTIVLIITFVLLMFSIVMIIKIDSKIYKTQEFSENNWDWIQKFYTRILKIEWNWEENQCKGVIGGEQPKGYY
jgi:hypothetical protein